MSTLAAGAATVHFPYMTGWPERASDTDRAATTAGFARLAAAFRAGGVDTVVAFTSEHIVNLAPRLAPPFTLGTGERHPAFPEPHFNLPVDAFAGDPELASWLHAALAPAFDVAHASELRLDHGTVLPLHRMELAAVRVVPIVINSIFPPLPPLARARALGEAVGAALTRCPLPRRVGLLATGGLSHTVGGPAVDRNDPAFDRMVLDALRAGDLDAVCAISDARLDAAGNGTHEIRNWIALAAAVAPQRFDAVTDIAFAPGWNTGVHQLVWSAA